MSTTFLVITDYPAKISSDLLTQITGGDNTIIDAAESDAAAMITDRIGTKYKVTEALAVTGTSRNRSLVRWMLNISVYFLYARVADMDIPERVVKDYDDTISDLDKIASGKLSTTIDRVTDSDTGTVTPRIRMGSNDARSHNPY